MPNERAQVSAALVKAEMDVRHEDMSELLDLADGQLKTVMRGLFEGVIGDRELEFKRLEQRENVTVEGANVVVDESIDEG